MQNFGTHSENKTKMIFFKLLIQVAVVFGGLNRLEYVGIRAGKFLDRKMSKVLTEAKLDIYKKQYKKVTERLTEYYEK